MARCPDSQAPSGSEPSPLVIRVDVEATQHHSLVLFRESFLAWLRDRSGNRFSRDIGAPSTIALEESGGTGERASTLRMTVHWCRESAQPRELAVQAQRAENPAIAARSGLAKGRFEFFEDVQSLAPLFTIGPYEDEGRVAQALRDAARARGPQRWAIPRMGKRLRVTARWPVLHPNWLRGAALVGTCSLLAVVGVILLYTFVQDINTRRSRFDQARQSDVKTGNTAPAVSPAMVATPLGTIGRVSTAADTHVAETRTNESDGPTPAAARRTEAQPPHPIVKPRERRAGRLAGLVGALLVGSEPAGAEVYLNGVLQGRTPLKLAGLPAGSRVVRLDLPGYERWSWSVAVVANKQTPVTARLRRDTRSAAPGSVLPEPPLRLP